MIYDPKEVEKWQKIQGSKNPLNDLRRQFRTGKLNRSDIPLIKTYYSIYERGKRGGKRIGGITDQGTRRHDKIDR